jgi:hypothetical protein
METKKLKLSETITYGSWVFKKWDGEQWPEKRLSVGTNGQAICISPRYFTEEKESEANFLLIALAGNLAQKHEPATWEAKLDAFEEMKGLFIELVKMQDETYGDLVWRLAVQEKADKFLEKIKDL